MVRTDTADRIVRTLRSADKPALSASDLAGEIDVSVKTINNNVEKLLDKDEISSTQIGNATAYYVPDSDLPAHRKPDHTCSRCGREVNETSDFAKIETDIYFAGESMEPEVADFYILCRFCYADLVSWLHDDPGSVGSYSSVHSWEIPEEQLQEVRDDPDVSTSPDGPTEFADHVISTAYQVFESQYEDPDEPVSEKDLRDALSQELSPREVERGFQYLERGGYFSRVQGTELLPAK